MIYYCSECKKAVMNLYDSADGTKTNLCAGCKAKLDKLATDKPIDKLCVKIDMLNERIDKMATSFKYNDNRCSEIESKHGNILKKLEALDKKTEELADWIASVENKLPKNNGGKNGRVS